MIYFMEAREFEFRVLKRCTNDFSEDNLIGKFQFGRIYRGTYQHLFPFELKEVVVKIWDDPKVDGLHHPIDNEARLFEEVLLLRHPYTASLPSLMRLIGYCAEGENLGVMYDFKALDTLQNLLLKESFTWGKRIRVALQLACLIEFLHTPQKVQLPYLVCNLDAAHLLLDEDYNLKLYDFGFISGGMFPDRREQNFSVDGCYGYVDPCARDAWSEESDVFTFGIVLLLLITKRDFGVENGLLNSGAPSLGQWATSEYEQHNSRPDSGTSKFSLVHQSLEGDSEFYSSDAPEVTKVAVECVASNPTKRPTMKQVVKRLSCMQVAQRHTDILGVEEHVSQWKAKLFSILGCVGFLKD